MKISIDVTGLKNLSNQLEQYEDKLQDTKPLMQELGNHIYNTVEESFENEKTPDGKPWSPIQVRASDRTPEKILYDEGTMQDTLYHEEDSNTATIGLNATSNGFPYPIVHQFGTEDEKIKARAFMPIYYNL